MSFVKALILFFMLTCVAFNAQSMDLENIRVNFEKAVSDKGICQTMIKKLSVGHQDALNLAYLGAFQAIWAKHVLNPVSKLKTFKKGKRNIEDAVKSKPDNTEIRFLRLSVQLNCPFFLGYSSNINEDKKKVQSNIQKIKSPVLKKMMSAII